LIFTAAEKVSPQMAPKYQVFCDNLSGMTWCPTLCADTLEEAVKNVTEGLSDGSLPPQNWMYYIYVLHQEKVPYWGAKPDIYKYVRAVSGKHIIYTHHTEGLLYALTTWQAEAGWLFADKLF
jgi:hypothetical protein